MPPERPLRCFTAQLFYHLFFAQEGNPHTKSRPVRNYGPALVQFLIHFFAICGISAQLHSRDKLTFYFIAIGALIPCVMPIILGQELMNINS